MTTYVKDLFTIIQAAGETYVGADAGENTTYMISPNLIEAGDVITIIDGEGTNTIQLVDGLEIASTIIANDEAVLTLSNGAMVNIRGAAAFNFDVGGNRVTGDVGEVKSYSEFVQQDLGLTVPDEGEAPVSGSEVTIGVDGDGPQLVTVTADIGTVDSAGTLDAADGGFIFTDDADVLNRVEISTFTSDDVIQISNAAEGDYQFSNNGSDMDITYNNDGVINYITLIGVVDSSDILSNEADFEAAIGFDAVTYV